jgi:hypothetical protein
MDQQIRLSGCIGFHIFAIQGLLCLLCGIDDAIISPFFRKDGTILYLTTTV